ncbi:alanine--tRNA ligase [Patescibacteria group bacterium]|nr:alanine--tRNA ligase [Patescibacteria group bacterium]MBU4057709.1 alanine--tRNA ligase [Patescibacteria group bacterium]MBU4115895.1 alanine--tRNA ligase [Patescibacteria group bacterium]
MITAKELKNKYLNFFKKRGHAIIPSASLIPENDPSVLFTTAGMHPLVPYLMGERHPLGNKLASVQKCIRTGDIEEVGNETHHTFFEMLGNWSLGDPKDPQGVGTGYFKKEAIEMSFEFLTNELKLSKDRLAFTVFAGDKDAPFDKEAFEIWGGLGIPKQRIKKLPKKDNWWGPAGETGPCGPDTEMFYWSDLAAEPPSEFNPNDKRWVEIWNDVFIQYNKTKEGNFELLSQKNIDTGMGLERTLAVIKELDDNYKTELFLPIVEKIEKLSNKKYNENKKEMRIITDHIKASVMILGDEKAVIPSNTGQGYVLRRLIRRAVRYAKILGIEKNFTADLSEPIIKIYKDIYPEVKKNEDFINRELEAEENKFRKTLEQGEKTFEKMSEDKNISGKEAFILFSTYGFPFELTEELAKEKGFNINTQEFDEEMKKHQNLSRTASVGMFKGGLADTSEKTKKLHTTAHLMLQAMRIVLGNHIEQKGSNITTERLRFDFSHSQKLKDEEKEKIEKIVNEQIQKKLPVWFEEMTLDEAKKIGATGVFEDKYGDRVKVYFVGKENDNFSKEICDGPHIENTSELGQFKIIKEEAISAGTRRIKAILE